MCRVASGRGRLGEAEPGRARPGFGLAGLSVPIARSVKIVATLGPACAGSPRLRELVRAGTNVFRLNFSHGTYEEHAEQIARVRAVAEELGCPVAILQDLQGPKIRTGALAGGGPVELIAGRELTITTRPVAGSAERVSTGYAALPGDLKVGNRLLVSDGLIELRVLETRADEVRTEIVEGGSLRERQGINLPGVSVSAPALTEKDLEDLAFGLAHGVDWIALSFVRSASDVRQLKARIEAAGHDTPVMAKIEKPEAVDVFDEILEVADGIMVARGDLGVEISPERVPMVQKQLISAAKRRHVPVVTATEMLQSMIDRPRPTRAEASDVANAILDGSDAVMLSGETAVGSFPVEAVRTMARIGDEIERSIRDDRQSRERIRVPESHTDSEAVATAVAALVDSERDVRAICVFTHTGGTPRLISSWRPAVPILAFCRDPATARRLAFLYGVHPELVESDDEMGLEKELLARATERGIAKSGDALVLAGSHPYREEAPANFLKLARLP